MVRSFLRSLVPLLALLSASTAGFAQQHVVYPTIPPPPHTPQEILLIFSGDTADERILLTLNNNRPDQLTTSITVYTASGVGYQLADATLVPQESRIIELSPLLQAAGLGHQELGWLKLDYSGVTLELGTQLTLYPTKGGPGIDSARSLSSDFKTTQRDAVFWVPGTGKAHLSLTNSSSSSIFVKMRCGKDPAEFVIPAKTTKGVELESNDEGRVNFRSRPLACEISSDGPVDALRPVGTVVAPGYTAPIRFYDPATATFPSLTAVGLQTHAETYATVANVTDVPVRFIPVLAEASLDQPYTESLDEQTLAPRASARVEVSQLLERFRDKGILHATLTLKTGAANGALIGGLTQIGTDDGLIEDIPLRTSNPPAFARGSYPLRWDDDYTNLVSVANTSEEKLRIGGVITAGAFKYVIKREDVAPGSTVVFDVDKWRRDGVPDVNGNTLPKDALYGKFHWIEMSNGQKAGLLGRASLASMHNLRRSSFSCGSTCEYGQQEYPYFDLQLFTTLDSGGNQVSAITESDYIMASGNYTYPVSYSSVDVSSDSPSIANTGPDPAVDSNIIEEGNSPGQTNITFYFNETQYQYDPQNDVCNPVDYSYYTSGPTSVLRATVNSADLSANQISVTLTGASNNTGTLTITLVGSASNYSFQYGTTSIGPGTYTIPMNRPNIPADKYTSIRAAWSLQAGVNVSGSRSVLWRVLGVIRHSQYNTPFESACTGSEISAWTIDVSSCQFTPISLRADFAGQVYVNGTGASQNYGVLKYTPGNSNQCAYPSGSDDSNTFIRVQSITGSCNVPLDNTSVATYPNPVTDTTTFGCGDNLSLITSSNGNQARKYPEDYCPSCNTGFNGLSGHIDNYSTSQSCRAGVVGDYGNYWTADTYGGN